MKKLLELQASGIKTIYLNGWIESVAYAISLSDVKHIGDTKSSDGYSTIECFETN